MPSEHKSNTVVSTSSANILCLKPRLARRLPTIDQGSTLIADPRVTVPPEIVPGLLHAGTKGVLASGSKAGKTWVLLDLATSIATGTSFLRWNPTVGQVLFINFEIHRAFIKGRLQVMKEKKRLVNLDNLNILTLRGQSADFDTLLEEIIERIQDEQYSLIVLDPIYKLMVGRSENGAGGVGALCHDIERLVEETGAAVMYAHHFTKGNAAKKKALDRMSGSGVFARDADTIITLTEHQEEGCYVVEITLRNFPPQPAFVVEWDFPVMVERPDLDPADLKQGEDEDNDLEPLLELLDNEPLTSSEWQRAAEAQGYSRATFFRLKQRLEAGNWLAFDRRVKTYSRAGHNQTQPSASTRFESRETAETYETPETVEAEIFAPTEDQDGGTCQALSPAGPAWPGSRFPRGQEQNDPGTANGP